MIRDLAQEPSASEEAMADVCVVGAGAAGIALAVELSRQGKRVTLLEGGGRVVEEASQRPYQGSAGALAHRGLHDGRVRALGGTTNLWGGQILELDALDFAQRSWVQGSGWPFGKSELTRFYARALQLEGVAGSLHDDAAVWGRVGEAVPEFPGLCAYVSRWCPEPKFAKLHGETLERSPNVEVWVHANAVELEIVGTEVTGVRCRSLTGVERVFRARRFCFCLGAIESSRFFLQPRAGGLPWNESGLLGRHFQDHIDCDAALIEPRSAAAFHAMFDAIFVDGYKYNPKLRLDAEMQERERVLHVGATFYSVSGLDATLSQLKETAKRLMRGRFGEISGKDAWTLVRHSPTLMRQAYRYGVEHRAFHPAGAQIRMRVHCEQEPTSASSVELCAERDELGLLRTKLLWTISELELRTIQTFVEYARTSLAGVATIVPDAALLASDDGFVKRCEDSFHHMGGMRMHALPQCGVVDPNLKLHGTGNAYVCSSAVFPTSGFSNPTHTLLALAARLAEHLSSSN